VGTLEDLKEIAEFVKEHGDDALYKKVIALQEKIINFNREETQLKIQLKDAKEKIAHKSKMIYKKPFYVQEDDDQPFCAVCWETDHKAIHLEGPFGEVDSTKRYYTCKVCKNWFYT
jgi:hypothetical protein